MMSSFHKILADSFFIAAFVAIFASAVSWFEADVWLASTQWVLVAIFLVLVGIYVKLSAEEDMEIIKSYEKDKKK